MGNCTLPEESKKEIKEFFNRDWRHNKSVKMFKKSPVIYMEQGKYQIYNLLSILDPQFGLIHQITFALGFISSLETKEKIKEFLFLIEIQDDYGSKEKINSFLSTQSINLPLTVLNSVLQGVNFLFEHFGKEFIKKALFLLEDFPLNNIFSRTYKSKKDQLDIESLYFILGALCLNFLTKKLKENKISAIYTSSTYQLFTDLDKMKYFISDLPNKEQRECLQKYLNCINKGIEKIAPMKESPSVKEECKIKSRVLGDFFRKIYKLIHSEDEFNTLFDNNNLFYLSIDHKNEVDAGVSLSGTYVHGLKEVNALKFNLQNNYVRDSYFRRYIKKYIDFYLKQYENLKKAFEEKDIRANYELILYFMEDPNFEIGNKEEELIIFEGESFNKENWELVNKDD